MTPALLAVGVLIGLTTVLFGFGGGFVTVPVVFAATQAGGAADPMHVAVATSTAVMIVNAGLATWISARRGALRTEYLWPLMGFVAVGAALGAAAAGRAPERALHVLFVAYLAATIADATLRRGFIAGRDRPRPLPGEVAAAAGTGIGAIASFLGVGGSVLTVPLLRRRGVTMAQATALANPLSLPVALAGTAVYALTPAGPGAAGRLGSIDLLAAAALLIGSLPTIALTRRLFDGRIPDRVHAVVYLVLLAVVTAAMLASLLGGR